MARSVRFDDPPEGGPDDAQADPPRARRHRSAISDWLRPKVERIGFVSAIVLPVLYLPLLFVTGPEPERLLALSVLLALHVGAIIVGANYEPGSAARDE